MLPLFLTLPIFLTGTVPEVVAEAPGFPKASTVWSLAEINGALYTSATSLTFPNPGEMAGRGPCNSFQGRIDGGAEDFRIVDLRVTRQTCVGQANETAFFDTLNDMTRIEMEEAMLVMHGADGIRMVFQPATTDMAPGITDNDGSVTDGKDGSADGVAVPADDNAIDGDTLLLPDGGGETVGQDAEAVQAQGEAPAPAAGEMAPVEAAPTDALPTVEPIGAPEDQAPVVSDPAVPAGEAPAAAAPSEETAPPPAE